MRDSASLFIQSKSEKQCNRILKIVYPIRGDSLSTGFEEKWITLLLLPAPLRIPGIRRMPGDTTAGNLDSVIAYNATLKGCHNIDGLFLNYIINLFNTEKVQKWKVA